MDPATSKFRQGLSEFKKGNYGEAFALFTAETQMDKDFADAFFHLGIIYAHQHDHDMANRYYNMTLSANPNHFGAQTQLRLENPVMDSAAAQSTRTSDHEFFARLEEDSGEAARNLLDAIETSDLLPKLQVKSRVFETAFAFVADCLILLVPAMLTGVLVGSCLYVMGFEGFFPLSIMIAAVIFLIEILQKYR